MNSRIRFLRRWLWLLIVIGVLTLVVRHLITSEEWRSFQWDRFVSMLRHVRPGYLFAAVAATLSTYLWRALRWRYFLDRTVPLRVLLAGQLIGFTCVYLIGRVGEPVRPAYVAHRSGVPLATLAAVWLIERIYDGVSLLLMLALALRLSPFHSGEFPGNRFLQSLVESSQWIVWVLAGLIAASLGFRLYAEKVLRYLSNPEKSPQARPSWRKGLEHSVRSFADGLGVLGQWRRFMGSVGFSILIWAANISVFWLVAQSIGGKAGGLTWLGACLAAISAVVGLTVQVPAVGGGFQVAVLLALTKGMQMEVVSATGVALLSWVVIMAPASLLGLVWMAREGLSLQSLRRWAVEEKSSGAGE